MKTMEQALREMLDRLNKMSDEEFKELVKDCEVNKKSYHLYNALASLEQAILKD